MNSSSMDEKVVSIQFDNRNFEKNVSTTMSTLDKLKEKLKFNGASKSLEKINSTANKIDLSVISNGVDTVRAKFSALDIVAVTAISRITNTMMNFASRTMSFLTNGVVEGGINRAMKIENARFQLQGLLKDSTAVAAVMQNVKDSVDGTAYSLDAAASVASQLAASGMRAGTQMYSALRAVAGVAAMTNSSYEDIGRIFTQVAGQGRVMGDDLLQLSTRGMNAAATLGKYLNKSESEVRDMVSKGKIDFNTFAACMDSTFGEHAKEANKTFSGALANIRSALARIGEAFVSPLIVENGPMVQLFNAIREKVNSVKDMMVPVLTDISNQIGTVISQTASFIRGDKLKDSSFKNILESFVNVFKTLQSVIIPIKQAFQNIFPPITSKQIFDITAKIRDFTKSLILNHEQMEKVKNIASGVFTVFRSVGDVIGHLVSAVFNMSTNFHGLFDVFLSIGSAIGSFVTKIGDSANKADILGKSISNVSNVLNTLLTPAANFASHALDTLLDILSNISRTASNVFSSIFDGLNDAFKTGNITNYTKAINDGIFGAVLLNVNKIVSNFGKQLKPTINVIDDFKKVVNNISKTLDVGRKALEQWQKNLKAKVLLQIAGAVGVLAASLVVLASIDTNRLSSALGAMTILFTELIAAMSVINKMELGSFSSTTSIMAVLMTMSTSILLLSSALTKISRVNPERLNDGLKAIGVLMGMIVTFVKLMSTNSKKVLQGSVQMLALSVSINILARAVQYIGKLNQNVLTKGLVGIGVLLGEIVAFLKLCNFHPSAAQTALGILLLSGALFILQKSITNFGSTDWETIGKGLVSIGATLGTLVLFLRNVPKTKDMLLFAAGMAIIVNSVLTPLAKSLSMFKGMSIDQTLAGLVAMSGMLLATQKMMSNLPNPIKLAIGAGALSSLLNSYKELADMLKVLSTISMDKIATSMVTLTGIIGISYITMKKISDLDSSSFDIVAIASSMIIFAHSIKTLSSIGLGSAAVGLGTLASTFGILYIAIKGLSPLTPSIIKLSGSIVTLSGSFIILGASLLTIGVGMTSILTGFVTAILALQSVSVGDLAKGLGAIAGIFTTIGVAAKLLKPMTGTIFSLSGSMLALGASCLAVSYSVSLMVGALQTLSLIGKENMKGVIDNLKELIVGVASIIPTVISSLLDGVEVTLLKTIEMIGKTAPQIAESLLTTLLETLKSLNKYGPEIVNYVLDFVIDVIDGLSIKMPQIMSSIGKLLDSIFANIKEYVINTGPDSIKQIVTILLELSGLMIVLAQLSSLTGAAMKGVLSLGVIIAELSLVLAALGGLSQIPGLNWLISEGGNFLLNIGNAIGKFVGGIVGGISAGVSNSLPIIGKNLSSFMKNANPFFEGLSKIDAGKVIKGSGAIVTSILALTVSGVIDKLSLFVGGVNYSKLASNFTLLGKGVKGFASQVNGIDTKSVTAGANALKVLATMTRSMPRSGGLFQWFAGSKDMDNFANGVKKFGYAISEFSKSVTSSGGIDVVSVQNACKAGELLTKMTKKLPNSGGLFEWFNGSKNLSSFAKNVKQFGKALKDFSKEVSGIKLDQTKHIVDVVDTIVKSITKIKKIDATNFKFKSICKSITDGLKVIDDNADTINYSAIAKFNSGLSQMLTILESASSRLQGMDIASVSKIKFNTIIKSLCSSLKTISENKDAFNQSAYYNVQNGVNCLGTMLSSIATKFKGLDLTNVGKIKFNDIIKSICSALKTIGANKDTFDQSAYQNIQNGMNCLGTMMKGISTSFQNVDLTNFNKVKIGDVVKAICSGLKTISENKDTFDLSAYYSIQNGTNCLVTMVKGISDGLGNVDVAKISGINFNNPVKSICTALKTIAGNKDTFDKGAYYSIQNGTNCLITMLKGVGVSLNGVDISSISNINFSKPVKSICAALKTMSENKDSFDTTAYYSVQYGANFLGGFIKSLSFMLSGVDTSVLSSVDFKGITSKVVSALTKITEADLSFNYDNYFTLQNATNCLGTLIKSLCVQLSGIDTSAIESVNMKSLIEKIVASLSYIANNTDSIPDTGTITKLLNTVNKMKEVIQSLVGIDTSGVEVYAKAVKSIADTSTKTISTSMKEGTSNAVSSVNSLFSSITNAANSHSNSVTNAFSNVITNAANAMKKETNSYNSIGKSLTISLSAGIKASRESVKSASSSVAKSAVSSAKGHSSEFHTIGANFSQGLASGILSGKKQVKLAGKTVAAAAAEAAQKRLEEHSPSKVGHKIGAFFTQGMGNGILDKIQQVKESSMKVAESTISVLKNTISNAGDFLSDDINLNPTVSPMMDLENIKAGFNQMNGMFGRTRSLALASSINVQSQAQSLRDVVDNAVNTAIGKITETNQNEAEQGNITIEVPVNLDGREVARATAPYTKKEIDKLQKRNDRKRGIL